MKSENVKCPVCGKTRLEVLQDNEKPHPKICEDCNTKKHTRICPFLGVVDGMLQFCPKEECALYCKNSNPEKDGPGECSIFLAMNNLRFWRSQ
jgi:RNA polymerase subunit RPABC4/transcription elongation factor Spt4